MQGLGVLSGFANSQHKRLRRPLKGLNSLLEGLNGSFQRVCRRGQIVILSFVILSDLVIKRGRDIHVGQRYGRRALVVK
jgi:hypothetical protein